MNDIQIHKRIKGQQRGRRQGPQAVAEIRALLGNEPRRRDLLIEHLHKIQDQYHGISKAHLHALASEMKLSQVEVYEVASFYHHFDLRDDEQSEYTAVSIRVCDSLSCYLAGAEKLYQQL